MDNPFKSPAILSFCPGLLGLERGIVRAIGSIRVMAYMEIEAFIIANLVAGMEAGILDPAPIWTNAKTFDARPFRGRIHGIIGGYPCPGESLAGLREGHLYKGFIWPAIRRAIDAARPLWCFFENVDDHLTGTYPIVQRSLRNMGYAVEAGVFTASEVGAPHERKRLFILALENSFELRVRRWLDERVERQCKVQVQGSSELGNSDESGFWRIIQEGFQSEIISSCKGVGLANAGYNRYGSIGKSQHKRIESQERPKEFLSGCQLADKPSQGLAEREEQSTREKFETIKRGSGIWPARPGEDQYEWEEPRTIESGLGCTVNGYNFREDFLRALGNSVVEQQAELAFRTLLGKFITYGN